MKEKETYQITSFILHIHILSPNVIQEVNFDNSNFIIKTL